MRVYLICIIVKHQCQQIKRSSQGELSVKWWSTHGETKNSSSTCFFFVKFITYTVDLTSGFHRMRTQKNELSITESLTNLKNSVNRNLFPVFKNRTSDVFEYKKK